MAQTLLAELNGLVAKQVQMIISGSKPETDHQLIAEFMERMSATPKKIAADEP